MFFDVAGPFKIKQHGAKQVITKESLRLLKTKLEEYEEGLSDACGCYVFAVRAGKGYTPYYVGQACKSSLPNEALNPSNISNYNGILTHRKGTPVLFFIPMRTPQGKFRKRNKTNGYLSSLTFLERWLIHAAVSKNYDLINSKETYFLKNIHVKGIFNARKGESTSDSQELAKALW